MTYFSSNDIPKSSSIEFLSEEWLGSLSERCSTPITELSLVTISLSIACCNSLIFPFHWAASSISKASFVKDLEKKIFY